MLGRVIFVYLLSWYITIILHHLGAFSKHLRVANPSSRRNCTCFRASLHGNPNRIPKTNCESSQNAGDNPSLCLIYDIHSCLLRFGLRFGWSTYLLSRWFGCVEFYFCIISRWFQIFLNFHPYFGKISHLTNIFQMG